MYEDRYKEEALERKRKDKSPLSVDLSTPADSPKNTVTVTKRLAVEEHQDKTCADERNVIHASVEDTTDTERKLNVLSEQRKDKENEKKMRKLFDDELFQSDLSIKQVKTSVTGPSLDAYAKAHKDK